MLPSDELIELLLNIAFKLELLFDLLDVLATHLRDVGVRFIEFVVEVDG